MFSRWRQLRLYTFTLIWKILISIKVSNPFINNSWFVNPTYYKNVEHTMDIYPEYVELLSKAQNISTFFWVNSTSVISNMSKILNEANKKSMDHNTSFLVQFVIYDIPNRDCSEDDSNGDFICENETCNQAIDNYKSQFIDPISHQLERFPNLTIILVIEPHALYNIAINSDMQKCADSRQAYITGIAYALEKFASIKAENIYCYIAAGNGAVLGSQDLMDKFVPIVKKVLNISGGSNTTHGFATNIGSYQPLYNVTSDLDPCALERFGIVSINEAIYIQFMDLQMNNAGIRGMYYITDTSQNGRIESMEPPPCNRVVCNDYQTGMHYKPSDNTSSTEIPEIINAFVWISVPGVSQGGSGSGLDFCSDPNAIKPSPDKGEWFPQYFLSMCENAKPEL
eukprot:254271_1